MTRLGIITGLASEAKLIEKVFARRRATPPALACSGPGPERARSSAERLLGQGAEALVSFGLCGGLDPDLKPGDLMLAEEVIVESGRALGTARALRGAVADEMTAAGQRVAGGAIIGQARVVARAEDKSALFAESGARAVDMESHAVALAAEAAGVPFLVARAIADPAEHGLPRAALKAVAPDGRIKVMATIATMYLRPWEGPAMVRVAYQTRLALDTLERVADPRGALFRRD